MRWLVACWLAGSAWGAGEEVVQAHEILRNNCVQCHSKKMAMSGLDLESREAALKGGQRGAAVVAGKASESKLIEVVERRGKIAMPPNKPLSEAEIAVLRRWIDGGAEWHSGKSSVSSAPTWWAFQPVQRPKVPAEPGGAAGLSVIDAFLQAKLKQEKLPLGKRATAATLVRRAYLDLWGLAPTAAQVEAFVNDKSPEAWPKLIDQLLDSPHYGEKWGRHWLDLVRYADTAGFELDTYIHDAWRYRDWVIQAFQEDKPYDRFIREQIAADELMPEDPVARTGTGLYCVGPNRDLFPDQADINREETLTDYVDTTSAVFLGLTAGCARCHDHKFDPISQEDYYRIRAIFAPATKVKVALNRLESLGYDVAESNREWKLREIGERIRSSQSRCQERLRTQKLNALPAEAREAILARDAERSPRQRELATQYEAQARVSQEEVRACLNPQERTALQEIEKSLVSMYANYRSKPFACGLADWWNVAPKTILPVKGSPVGREVAPGFFSVLGGGEVPPPAEHRETTGPIPLTPTTGRRTALAQWISDPKNPLTARVMVNRIWQYHFGRGLLASSSDFGTRSGKASHPELLDWLAAEFVARGWSIKQMHRLMMNTHAYQQESTPSAQAVQRDPMNVYLSHFTRRRLSAEELRDSLLLASGALNAKRGGRPVVPPLTEEEKATLTQSPENAWVLTADASEHFRRSIYMIQKRTFRMPMMEVFDAPETMLTCARRDSSTTAPQSLSLFNGAFTRERAQAMAQELQTTHGASDAAIVQAAWRQILSRNPDADELRRAQAFLKTQSVNTGTRGAAVAELVRALFNLNEFLYVD